MSQEMPIFVSLIVWLFCVTGADGDLSTKPENFVILKNYAAVLECSTNSGEQYVQWRYQNYITPNEDAPETDAVNSECLPEVTFVNTNLPKYGACHLLVYDTENNYTHRYVCTDVRETFHGIVMVLESNLTCGIEDNKYSCKMANSAYFNQSTMNTPYISSRLVWKDANGTVVNSQDSDFQTPGTVVATAIPDRVSKDHPFVCSAEFNVILEGQVKEEFSDVLHIIPYDKFECKFPLTEEHVEEAQVAAVAAEAEEVAAAAAREEEKAKEEARKKASSNANLERDGVDAIAMMLSLMAAFLVY